MMLPDLAALDALKDKRFLVVDDEPVNLRFFAHLFEDLELTLEVAGDGREAVTKILANPPQRYALVLMDIRMPGLNGIAATREIRSRAEYRSLPIVAMSGNAREQDRELYLGSGMVDLLAKPASLEEIIAILQKWAGSDTAAQAGVCEPAPAPPTKAQELDLEQRLVETGLSPEQFRPLLQAFTATLGANLGALKAAHQARSPSSAADAAHKLAGACGNIGAYGLRAALKSLQTSYEEGDFTGATLALDDIKARLHRLREELEPYTDE